MEMKEGQKRVGGPYYSQAERAPSVEEGGRWKVEGGTLFGLGG